MLWRSVEENIGEGRMNGVGAINVEVRRCDEVEYIMYLDIILVGLVEV